MPQRHWLFRKDNPIYHLDDMMSYPFDGKTHTLCGLHYDTSGKDGTVFEITREPNKRCSMCLWVAQHQEGG